MSKKEEAGVEELSQTTSPPLYFAYSASVSMLFLSFSFLCDFFSGFFCFQHLSTAATLSVKASGRLGLSLSSQTGAEGAPQLP